MKTDKPKYQPTNLLPIIKITARMIKNNPHLLDDEDLGLLRAQLREAIPALGDKSHCPNCRASMKSSIRKVDYHVITLLQSMARIVRNDNRIKGVPFTEANKLHVNARDDIPHNSRNNTGVASDLGLIAPVEGMDAHWAITRRGWAGLRGEEIPKRVETFRGAIITHFPETTTFPETLANSKAEGSKSTGYDPQEWYEFGETQQGVLI